MSKTTEWSPSSTSYSPGVLATGKGKPVARYSGGKAASSSPVRQSDVNPSSSAGTLDAKTTENSVSTRLSHHLRISYVGHLVNVCSNARQKLARQPKDDMLEIDVNMMIWGIFMSATTNAAAHLGRVIKIKKYMEYPRLIGIQFHG